MRAALADAGGVLWVDIDEADADEVEQVLTRVFGLHELIISDCLENVRRPKLDDYGDCLFAVVHAVDQSTPLEDVTTVELDVCIGPNYVVTHHALPVPVLDQVAERAMQDEGLMNRGADVLAYEILKAVTSDHRPIVNYLAAAVAGVEVEVLRAPTSDTLHRMHELRHDVLRTRRRLAAQQGIMRRLASDQLQPIHSENRVYFRELTDRFAQMLETVHTLNESMHGVLQTHLSVVSNQTNSLLRFVAALVAFLLPLTLLAVLYSTNIIGASSVDSPFTKAAVLGITLVGGVLLAFWASRR